MPVMGLTQGSAALHGLLRLRQLWLMLLVVSRILQRLAALGDSTSYLPACRSTPSQKVVLPLKLSPLAGPEGLGAQLASG